MKRYRIEIGRYGLEQIEDQNGPVVSFTEHQADLDRVMGEAVKFAKYVTDYHSPEFILAIEAQIFLASPEVRDYLKRRERQ